MKLTFTFLVFFIGFSLFAQEKIAEFNTTHSVMAGYNTKTKTQFVLYKDSLVMAQIDKRMIKVFTKRGLPLSTTFVHSFIKEETPFGVQYTFRNETEDYFIITESKAAKPSVLIRNKDTFTDKVFEQVYFSI